MHHDLNDVKLRIGEEQYCVCLKTFVKTDLERLPNQKNITWKYKRTCLQILRNMGTDDNSYLHLVHVEVSIRTFLINNKNTPTMRPITNIMKEEEAFTTRPSPSSISLEYETNNSHTPNIMAMTSTRWPCLSY